MDLLYINAVEHFQPHLKVEYIPVKGQKQYCDMMRDLSGALDKNRPTPDYLEATVFSKEEAVIMVGNFADVPPSEQHKVSLCVLCVPLKFRLPRKRCGQNLN